ncbi:MAG: HAD family hydrolase [Muribaculaceae bacterium]|nr:HAD family hydrolase [Muribaculaceae bacterium]
MDISYHGPVVVFDLDDTLFRERDYCRSGFRLIERRLLEIFGPRMLGIGMRMGTLLNRRENYFTLLEMVLAEAGAPDELMPELVSAYRSHIPVNLPLAPGAGEMLEALRQRGVVMAIVTDGRSVTQRAKINATGLDRFIAPENIYISEEQGADKTHPDSFRKIVAAYPEASRFIYLGDNARKDFYWPNMLGWSTFMVPRHHDNVHPDYQPVDQMEAPGTKLGNIGELICHLSGG